MSAYKKCVYLNCENTRASYTGQFFLFPKNAEMQQQWLKRVGNALLSDLTEKQLRFKLICDKHFYDRDFSNSTRARLNKNVIPMHFNKDEFIIQHKRIKLGECSKTYQKQKCITSLTINSGSSSNSCNTLADTILHSTKTEVIPVEESDIEENACIQTTQEQINLPDAEHESQSEQSYNNFAFVDIGYTNTDEHGQNKKRQASIDIPKNKIVLNLKEKSHVENQTLKSEGDSIETMDEMDMFFLSMARMTKKLPKVDQAQIKLALSNSVLSAEIRNQQQLCSASSSHHAHSTPYTMQATSSPSDGSSFSFHETSEEIDIKPTLLELGDLS